MARTAICALLFAMLLPAFLANSRGQESISAPTNQAELNLAASVKKLLDGRDAALFAREVVATVDDCVERRLTNGYTHTSRPWPASPEMVDQERQKIADSARHFLDLATKLGVNPTNVQFRVLDVRAPLGKLPDPMPNMEIGMLPFAGEITVKLAGQSTGTNRLLTGEYEVILTGGMKFSRGWRIYEGMRWARFPTGAAGESMERELRVVSKVSSGASLNETDDPALASLGTTVIQFLQQRNERILQVSAMTSYEDAWKSFQKALAGRAGAPSRQEFTQQMQGYQEGVLESARQMLAQMERLGIDFAGAKISVKSVNAEHPIQTGTLGGLAGVNSQDIRLVISVQSDKKSKSEKSIAGDYFIATGRSARDSAGWKIENTIHWEKFPDGLADTAAQDTLTLENYVGRSGMLPPGTPAPDIELVRIPDSSKARLSSFQGKIVLLDFWSTACPPCQAAMANLQTLRTEHSDWKDKVEIVSLSIDGQFQEAKEHLTKRGWTNTVNEWAGPGGFASAVARQFRLRAIPTQYLIGADGRIVAAGSGGDDNLVKMIPSLLAP